MDKIPLQLKNSHFRFCLLKPKSKIPFENKWSENGYQFFDKKLRTHIKQNGNYGVIGGYGNLRILDIDKNLELGNELFFKLNTFTIQTGGGGFHFYILTDYDKNHILKDKNGEFRANNYQVVAPNCIHPNGNSYKIVNDVPIRELSKEELLSILEPLINKNLFEENKTLEERPKDQSRSGLEYRRILAFLHDGKSKEEIFEEMNSYSKWFNGSNQYKELTYKKAFDFFSEIQKNKVEEFKEELFLLASDLKLKDFKREWLIKDLILKNSLTILAGKSRSFKSWLSLYFSICCCYGIKILNNFETKKTNCLFLDSENGEAELFRRLNLICSGLNVEIPENLFLSKNPFFINEMVNFEKLKEFVRVKNIGLIIIDSYKRFFAIENENDASAVENLVRTYLMEFKKLNCDIVLLSHVKKSNSYFSYDDLESIRGSSELMNRVDIVLLTERLKNKSSLILKTPKNRTAKENPDFEINLIWSSSESESKENVFSEFESKQEDMFVKFEYLGTPEEEATMVKRYSEEIKTIFLKHFSNGEKTLKNSEIKKELEKTQKINGDTYSKALKLLQRTKFFCDRKKREPYVLNERALE